MQLAISTVCLTENTWQECFEYSARAGYKNVELLMIPGWHHVAADETTPTEIIAEARRNDVEVAVLHGGGIDGSSPVELAKNINYVKTLAHFAEEAGVPMINFNGGQTPKGTSAQERIVMAGKIGAALRPIEPILKDLGVRLTLENHFGFQLQQPEDYSAVLDALGPSTHIGITLDTGHFSAADVDMVAFVQKFGSHIFHVHIKDHIGLKSVALGKGQTNNAAVIAALRKQGYDGTLTIEMEVEDRANALQYVNESLPYMRKLLSEG